MASVEAAASLFGTDDAADPFSSLGTEATAEKPVQHAEDLFGSSNKLDVPDFLHSKNEQGTPTFPTDHSRATSGQISAGDSSVSHYQPPNGYVQYGDVNGSGQVYKAPTPSVYGTSSTAAYSPAYDSHAPQPNYSPQKNVNGPSPTNSYVPQVPYGHTTAVPDPYAPRYTSSTYSQPEQAYSTYAPATYDPSQPNNHYGYVPPTSNSYSTFHNPVPPPVAAPLEVERPKIANAYDPPLPAFKPRRSVSRPKIVNAYDPPLFAKPRLSVSRPDMQHNFYSTSPPSPMPLPPRAPSAGYNHSPNYGTSPGLPAPPPRAPSVTQPPPRAPSVAQLPRAPSVSQNSLPSRPSSVSQLPPPPRVPSVSQYSPPSRPSSVSQFPSSPRTSSVTELPGVTHAHPPIPLTSATESAFQTHFFNHADIRQVDGLPSTHDHSIIEHNDPESPPPASSNALFTNAEDSETSTYSDEILAKPVEEHRPFDSIETVLEDDEAAFAAPNGTIHPETDTTNIAIAPPPADPYSYSPTINNHVPRVSSPLTHTVRDIPVPSADPYAPQHNAGKGVPPKSTIVSPPSTGIYDALAYKPPPQSTVRSLPPTVYDSSAYKPVNSSTGSSMSTRTSSPPNQGYKATATNAYDPPFDLGSRTMSPGSDRSIHSPPSNHIHAAYAHLQAQKPLLNHTTPVTSYTPQISNVYVPTSETSLPKPPLPASNSTVSAYTPSSKAFRERAPSNGSISNNYISIPSRTQSSDSGFGSSYTSRYDYPNNDIVSQPSQEILLPPTQSMYAPSPSLMGTNDPLGRASARVPVFSFGFGGKFVTCFHGSSVHTGFDVALASKASTGIEIRALMEIIPSSALNTHSETFPGPLYMDPEASTSLVRSGAAAQKTKKAKVVGYITSRVQELSLGINYLQATTLEGRRAEGKLILLKILRIMVENDGKFSGSTQIESSIRAALVPRLDFMEQGASGPIAGLPASISAYSTFVGGHQDVSKEIPISVSTLRPSALHKIEEFLLRGERRKAYHYALDEKLWGHAMVIASGIDKEAWQEVVNEFLQTELRSNDHANTQDGLRVVYSLLSGQGATAVQQLVPKNVFDKVTAPNRLGIPVPVASAMSAMTPMTPNFSAPPLANNIPQESLAKWADILAMMLTSPVTPETSSTITAFGDQLLANQWVEAAHVCYILSPSTSPLGGLTHPTARIILLGSSSPQICPTFARDVDSIIFSEILEFALSLATPAKGQEAFAGLPHLQPYKIIRAASLCEMGNMSTANRYCEAITNSLGRGSPYFTHVFLEQLKGMTDRIAGVHHTDKSFLSGKISKPSLDTIGNWFGDRLTKFVDGDPDSATLPEMKPKPAEQGFVGPFSHFSEISSATTSSSPSPVPSFTNPYVNGPARPDSASSFQQTPDRASSAMDYSRSRPSPPVNRISSASAATTSFAQSLSRGLAPESSMVSATSSQETSTPRASIDEAYDEDGTAQEVTWWGAYNGAATDTPTATTFMKVENATLLSSTSDGFVSMMDTPLPGTPVPLSTSSLSKHVPQYDEEEEDLGFGNSKPKPKKEDDNTTATSKPAERPDPKPVQSTNGTAGGSWISRWWKGEGGPVKANLGEEKSFYYDKDLKRWVNKNATEDVNPTASLPPPPPSRTQTASPSMAGGHLPPSRAGSTGPPPPPPRSSSAMDMSSEPPQNRTVMRVRSNLVPATPESAPSTPTGTRLTPPGPPPGRPKSSASSKRSMRSRYVDVLAQEGAGGSA